MSGVFVYCSPPHTFEQNLSLLAKLAEEGTLGIFLSLPPNARVTGMCGHAWLFNVSVRALNSGPHAWTTSTLTC